MRGIIVDDEPLMIEAFKRLSSGIENLKLEGAFESAEEAIEFSENHSFEIAFLDIELPEMNGIECAKALREKMPGILIVFISAYDDYLRESIRLAEMITLSNLTEKKPSKKRWIRCGFWYRDRKKVFMFRCLEGLASKKMVFPYLFGERQKKYWH